MSTAEPVQGSVVVGRTPEDALGAWRAPPGVRRIVVAIPDATRPLDPRPALAALQRRSPVALDVVVGLGLHRPMGATELAALDPWRPRQSDPDDWIPTAGVDGVPGTVSRWVQGADLLIGVGVGELHQYAGVSGGHKAVAVGLGGRPTIAALHARKLVTAAGVRLGVVRGNPFRAAVDGLGVAAGCRHALLHVPSTGEWLWGDPARVVAEAAQRIAPWRPERRTYDAAVLHVPPAKASSFYQASRAATYLGLSPRPPLRAGARLVLRAACAEGLGAEAGFVAALASTAPPWTALLDGPEPTGAGAQRAVMVALVARKYRIEVVGCEQAAALRAVGIAATREDAVPTGVGVLDVPAPFEAIPQMVSPAG